MCACGINIPPKSFDESETKPRRVDETVVFEVTSWARSTRAHSRLHSPRRRENGLLLFAPGSATSCAAASCSCGAAAAASRGCRRGCASVHSFPLHSAPAEPPRSRRQAVVAAARRRPRPRPRRVLHPHPAPRTRICSCVIIFYFPKSCNSCGRVQEEGAQRPRATSYHCFSQNSRRG